MYASKWPPSPSMFSLVCGVNTLLLNQVKAESTYSPVYLLSSLWREHFIIKPGESRVYLLSSLPTL